MRGETKTIERYSQNVRAMIPTFSKYWEPCFFTGKECNKKGVLFGPESSGELVLDEVPNLLG
jgi:hypothetical protein